MKSSPAFASCILLVSAFALAGCASAPAASDAEYEYVTPLGSNIPVRVKKGEKAATASPTGTVSAEQATNAIRGGGGQMTPPRGAGGP